MKILINFEKKNNNKKTTGICLSNRQWVNIGPGKTEQATSHYLNQCWPRSMVKYEVFGEFNYSC